MPSILRKRNREDEQESELPDTFELSFKMSAVVIEAIMEEIRRLCDLK